MDAERLAQIAEWNKHCFNSDVQDLLREVERLTAELYAVRAQLKAQMEYPARAELKRQVIEALGDHYKPGCPLEQRVRQIIESLESAIAAERANADALAKHIQGIIDSTCDSVEDRGATWSFGQKRAIALQEALAAHNALRQKDKI